MGERNIVETTPKRRQAVLKGVQFDKNYQPSSKAKKAGWSKKFKGQELIKAVLNLDFKGPKNSELKRAAAEYFGLNESDLTVEVMMHMRQAEKAIQKADTAAYNSLLNRAYGMPKQAVDLESRIKIKVTRTRP